MVWPSQVERTWEPSARAGLSPRSRDSCRCASRAFVLFTHWPLRRWRARSPRGSGRPHAVGPDVATRICSRARNILPSPDERRTNCQPGNQAARASPLPEFSTSRKALLGPTPAPWRSYCARCARSRATSVSTVSRFAKLAGVSSASGIAMLKAASIASMSRTAPK
jgi:hypothetical protein